MRHDRGAARQLDSYGDHVETLIDHVTADEVLAVTSKARPARSSRRRLRALVAAAPLVVVVVVGVALLVGSVTGDRVSTNFSAISGTLGGETERNAAFIGESDISSDSAGIQAPTTTTATTRPPNAQQEEPAGTPVTPADFGRDIIFTAELVVAVTDSAAAADQARAVVEAAGGFVFSRQTTGRPEATNALTLKVPPDGFQDLINRLGDIGFVRNEQVSAEDVTELVVDIESRIETAATSVDRLQSFLAEAGSVADLAQLERELLTRETELATLRGQLRSLEEQVGLATVVVTFTEELGRPRFQVAVTSYKGGGDAGADCLAGGNATLREPGTATVCVVITNNDTTPLIDITLSGPGVDLLRQPFVEVIGDLEHVLKPEESVVLAAEISVVERIQEPFEVSAVPVNDGGDPIPDQTLTKAKNITIGFDEPDTRPGFFDAVAKGWSGLTTLIGFGIIAVGLLLPFVWIPVLAWLGL